MLDALNSLPGVSLGTENQGSLEAAAELHARHQETQLRAVGSAGKQDPVQNAALLCTLQQWYVTLTGTRPQQSGNASTGPIIRGFKELLSSPVRSTVNDRESSTPAVHHLSVSESLTTEPLWLQTLEDVFPCSKIM